MQAGRIGISPKSLGDAMPPKANPLGISLVDYEDVVRRVVDAAGAPRTLFVTACAVHGERISED